MSVIGRKWTEEIRAEVRARLARGERPRDICAALDVGVMSVTRERRAMVKEAYEAGPRDAPATNRRDDRDAAFWRAKARAAEKSLADQEHLTAELAGVTLVSGPIPEWTLPQPGRRGRAVVGALISDVHAGEVIDPDEMDGLNAYDLDVCRARLRRYFSAVIEIGQRWTSDCVVEGCLVALAGDLVSGDIHDELKITNALTSHEQVLFMVEELRAGILHLVEAFGRVHIVSVPGNHGRTTLKDTAKLYSRLSYDTLVAKLLRDRFEGETRVTFQVTSSFDAVVPILGHTVTVTHGHKMGTGGGQGFAGPMLPIIRGAKKLEAQQARANRRPDLILHGHYHTSGNAGGVLSNGSVVGYGEYAKGLRAGLEPPQQWAFVIHEKWGLRDRAEIKLEDPGPPPKPVVRVPAQMERR
jgi:hypothetical protein